MATLLEICNEVLLNIGENPVTYETHPVARKVFAAYRTALSHVSTLYKWPHLIAERSPTFVGDIGTFASPTVQHVLDVLFVQPPSTRYRLNSVGRRNLWAVGNVEVQPYSEDTRPHTWSNYSSSQIRLYPAFSILYSTFIRCLVVNSPTLPATLLTPGQVTLPEDFLQAVKYYTEFLMHIRHTADMVSANAAQSVFEQYVHMLRSRKSGEPVSNLWGDL